MAANSLKLPATTSEVEEVTLLQHPASSHDDPDDERMAIVIPLMQPDRGQVQAAPNAIRAVASDPAREPDRDPLSRAVELLRRRAGDQWTDLPGSLGRSTARLEALLIEGPTHIDATEVAPADVLARATQVISATTALFELISEEVTILGEVLSADLSSAPLTSIHEVADSALALAALPRAAPHWGDPASADAAELVLDVLAEDLRSAARAHELLYTRFTESIWQVPAALLRAGRHRWRPVARLRLRRQLRAASRSDRVGSVAAAAKDVLEVRAIRERVDALAPLLAHHLADLDCGALSDVDTALLSLRALRRLQARLGDGMDGERMQQLLLADAFRSHDVTGPSLHIRNGILAWQVDVGRAGATAHGDLSLDALAAWTRTCAELLPALRDGSEAADRSGVPATSLRALVDLLLVRQLVEELASAAAPRAVHGSGSAS